MFSLTPAVADGGVLGEDRDPLLTLEIHRVEHAVVDGLPGLNAPDCHSSASTSVVLPWSTWATIAMLRMSERIAMPGWPG